MIPSLLPSLSPLLPFIFPPLFLAPITQHNPTLAEVFLLHLHTAHPDHRGTYIDALASLPPTLPSLDLISKLLREPVSGAEEENDVSLGEVVRFDVLGRFWGQVVDQLDGLEVRRRAGSGGSGQVEEELARGVSIVRTVSLPPPPPLSAPSSLSLCAFACRRVPLILLPLFPLFPSPSSPSPPPLSFHHLS